MTTTEQSLRRRISQLVIELDEKRKTVAGLKDFYGDPSIYERAERPVIISEGQARIATTEPLVMLDRGKRAREAK